MNMVRLKNFGILLCVLILCVSIFSSCKKTADTDAESSVPAKVSPVIQSEPESSSEPAPEESSQPETTPPPAASSTPSKPKPTTRVMDLTPYKDVLFTIPPETIETLPNIKAGWGVGYCPQGVRPSVSPAVNSLFSAYDACFIGENEMKVFLTFDCGYENGQTAKILDTLWQTDVKAVFFCTTPFVRDNPQLVERMLNEGHTLGNHSVSHKSFPSLTTEQMISEILDVDRYVYERYGYKMSYFRFPSGEHSEKTLAAAKSCGYKSIFWSFAYLDYDVKNQPTVAKAKEMVLTRAHPGAIYLLHAVSSANAGALPEIISGLRAQGYTISLLNF